MTTWQIVDVAVTSNQETQLQSPTPVRDAVPMEEQEARASRFVSHLAGHTDSERPPSNSSRVLPSPQASSVEDLGVRLQLNQAGLLGQ